MALASGRLREGRETDVLERREGRDGELKFIQYVQAVPVRSGSSSACNRCQTSEGWCDCPQSGMYLGDCLSPCMILHDLAGTCGFPPLTHAQEELGIKPKPATSERSSVCFLYPVYVLRPEQGIVD